MSSALPDILFPCRGATLGLMLIASACSQPASRSSGDGVDDATQQGAARAEAMRDRKLSKRKLAGERAQ